MNSHYKTLLSGIGSAMLLISGTAGWTEEKETRIVRDLQSNDLPTAGVISPQETIGESPAGSSLTNE